MPLLSTVDISADTTGWTCEHLEPETVLLHGLHLVEKVASTIRYLEELP